MSSAEAREVYCTCFVRGSKWMLKPESRGKTLGIRQKQDSETRMEQEELGRRAERANDAAAAKNKGAVDLPLKLG